MDTGIANIGLAVRDTKDAKSAPDRERAGAAAAPWMPRIEEHPSWEILSQMRVTLHSQVALSQFRVRDLLALAEGQVFESLSPHTEDVPLKVGRVQLGWGEFEVVEQQIALRLTRLA